jgi:hypothetical protein
MSNGKRSKHFGEQIIDQVLAQREEGKTHHEIAEIFGLRNAMSSRNLVKRYYEKRRKLAQGILLRKKGRPARNEDSLVEENRRLKQAIEILTLFHQAMERK